jgi:hypothetical protein
MSDQPGDAVEQEKKLREHEKEARERDTDERRPEQRPGDGSDDDHNPQAGMQRTG